MPNYRSARRALKTSRRNRLYNLKRIRGVRRIRKDFLKAAQSNATQPELEKLAQTLSQLVDRAAQKNTMHRNTAARIKSSAARLITSIYAPQHINPTEEIPVEEKEEPKTDTP